MTRTLCLLALALTPPAAVAQPAADLFAAPDGNDAWSGTRPAPNAARTDGPFATPGRALDAARQLREADPPARPVTVLLRGGRYELKEPLALTPADSGTKAAPLVLAAFPGETPVLSGGALVRPKVEDGVWVVPVPGAKALVRHISVGGELRLAARRPKRGQLAIAGLAGADPKASYRTPRTSSSSPRGRSTPPGRTWPTSRSWCCTSGWPGTTGSRRWTRRPAW